MDGSTVTLSNFDAICASFAMIDVPSNNAFVMNNSSSISIHGGLLLDDDMTLDLFDIFLESPLDATINTNGNSLGSECLLYVGGLGTYDLNGGLHVSYLEFDNGDFNSNGFPMSIDNEVVFDADLIGTIDLTDSNVDVDEWNPGEMASSLVIENTSFLCTGNFHCSGLGENQK